MAFFGRHTFLQLGCFGFDRFSSLGDEYIPSDPDEYIPSGPDDSDPHEDDIDSSKTPSTSRFQVMQKQGPSDSELLNEAIDIAA